MVENTGNFDIRSLDPFDSSDVDAFMQILRSPGVRRWVVDVPGIDTWQQIYDYASAWKNGETRILFVGSKKGEIQGYAYFFPTGITDGALEMTYAKKPGAKSGKMAELVKQSVLKLKERLGFLEDIKILAKIDPENIKSINVAKKAGFEYAGDSIWQLNWEKVSC